MIKNNDEIRMTNECPIPACRQLSLENSKFKALLHILYGE
jgi:hypothetical protein